MHESAYCRFIQVSHFHCSEYFNSSKYANNFSFSSLHRFASLHQTNLDSLQRKYSAMQKYSPHNGTKNEKSSASKRLFNISKSRQNKHKALWCLNAHIFAFQPLEGQSTKLTSESYISCKEYNILHITQNLNQNLFFVRIFV